MSKILIVDDVAINVDILVGLLERPSYQIYTASGGKEALEIAFRELPDLVLLDVSMPVVDGYQVCKELQGNTLTKHIPVVFVTAHTDEEAENYGLSLGAVDYITKPLRPAIVTARVRLHLELKRLKEVVSSRCTLDELTGLATRHTFDNTLQSVWNDALKNSSNMALLIADIDYFRALNDEYGSEIGDDCLKQVAKVVYDVAGRHCKLVTRYGGGEFAILFSDLSQDAAMSVAERVRQSVMTLGIEYTISQFKKYLSVSVGAGTMTPSADASATQLQRAAEEALFRAKNQGRNCCVLNPV